MGSKTFLLMGPKIRLTTSWYSAVVFFPIIYKVLFQAQVVVWDFWTIKLYELRRSIKHTLWRPMIFPDWLTVIDPYNYEYIPSLKLSKTNISNLAPENWPFQRQKEKKRLPTKLIFSGYR